MAGADQMMVPPAGFEPTSHDDPAVQGVQFHSSAGIREVLKMKRRAAIALLSWVLYTTTGSAAGVAFFPTETACRAAGQEAVADGKAAKAKAQADEAAFEREHPGESEGTTIGYDVKWKCTESKPKPQSTPPS